MTTLVKSKCATLHDELKKVGRIAVAFSGGVDSAFLLKSAHDILGPDLVAISVELLGSPVGDIEFAVEFCSSHSIRHKVLAVDEFSIEGFAENSKERCYICKRALFSKIIEEANRLGFETVADGTNADDLCDFRPGLAALKELGVISPLAAANFSKTDILDALDGMGLKSVAGRQASACLSSRIPVGAKVTREKLLAIKESENSLLQMGLKKVRVRHFGDIALIETDNESLDIVLKKRQRIAKAVKATGFRRVALDLECYRLGSMNEALGVNS